MIADVIEGSCGSTLRDLDKANASRRLWKRDRRLWKPDGPEPKELADRLGWLDCPASMAARLWEFRAFAEKAKAAGIREAVLLGMGGSSLCPELLASSFGPQSGFPTLNVLDTTAPDAVLALRKRLDLAKTLFIVASKSGSTIETACLAEYFRGEIAGAGLPVGAHFAAITDPGTPAETQARDLKYEGVFLSPPDVGGRYSALTPFGLVPAALLGLPLEKLLASAKAMADSCGPDVPPSRNPAFRLGAWLGRHALEGRDKATFLISPPLACLGGWLEQLIAESTGKEGKGIVPVCDEAPLEPDAYDDDRVFIYLRLGSALDAAQEKLASSLSKAGRPILTVELRDSWALGGEFFRWEAATAAAGAVLGINPFDQPNVQESKDLTKEELDAYAKAGRLREPPSSAPKAEAVRGLIGKAGVGEYIAILAFLAGTPGELDGLAALRRAIGAKTRRATTLGLGPRFLHSTGQLHKGGPDRGVFLQLAAPAKSDANIPGRPYSFAVLHRSQGAGDFQALSRRGRRILRIDLGSGAEAALKSLAGDL